MQHWRFTQVLWHELSPFVPCIFLLYGNMKICYRVNSCMHLTLSFFQTIFIWNKYVSLIYVCMTFSFIFLGALYVVLNCFDFAWRCSLNKKNLVCCSSKLFVLFLLIRSQLKYIIHDKTSFVNDHQLLDTMLCDKVCQWLATGL